MTRRDRKADQTRDLFADTSPPGPEPAKKQAPANPSAAQRHIIAWKQKKARNDASPDPPPGDAAPVPAQTGTRVEPVTVATLTGMVRDRLEDAFRRVWVGGELTGVKLHRGSGHLFFSLKDEQAVIRCVMWQSQTRALKFRPDDGLHVIAYGMVSVFEARGDYQLYVSTLEPRGKGAQQVAVEQLRRQLAQEGLFDRERKRPLPFLPRAVGIVTSLNGAALHDMTNVIHRRFPAMRIIVSHAAVQGETAAAEVAIALRRLNRYARQGGPVDVVLLGRGGGSMEDLSAFNSEQVARAIAGSDLPVVSAVGHETDVTIADLVADRRALSPSEGAELVVPPRDELLRGLDRGRQRMQNAIRRVTRHSRQSLDRLAGRLDQVSPQRRVREHSQKLVTAQDRLDSAMCRLLAERRQQLDQATRVLRTHHPQARLAALRERLATLRLRLDRAGGRVPAHARAGLRELAGRLDALSPLRVLERGYSVTLDANGGVIADADTVQPGDTITTRLHRGRLHARIERTDPADPDA